MSVYFNTDCKCLAVDQYSSLATDRNALTMNGKLESHDVVDADECGSLGVLERKIASSDGNE